MMLDELVRLMDIAPLEATLLAQLQPAARLASTALTDTFDHRLFSEQEPAEYLLEARPERMNAMLADWFLALFSGTYDRAYARQRLGSGAIHVRIGLPVRYALTMLDVIVLFGEQVAQQSSDPEQALRAFRKVLALDVALFNQAYDDQRLRQLSTVTGGERLVQIPLIGLS